MEGEELLGQGQVELPHADFSEGRALLAFCTAIWNRRRKLA